MENGSSRAFNFAPSRSFKNLPRSSSDHVFVPPAWPTRMCLEARRCNRHFVLPIHFLRLQIYAERLAGLLGHHVDNIPTIL